MYSINHQNKMEEQIKNTIRGIVENHIDNQINYEWEGSDFLERLRDELPEELSEIEITQNDESSLKFDNELYQKFLNHLTDFIYSSLKIN